MSRRGGAERILTDVRDHLVCGECERPPTLLDDTVFFSGHGLGAGSRAGCRAKRLSMGAKWSRSTCVSPRTFQETFQDKEHFRGGGGIQMFLGGGTHTRKNRSRLSEPPSHWFELQAHNRGPGFRIPIENGELLVKSIQPCTTRAKKTRKERETNLEAIELQHPFHDHYLFLLILSLF